MGRRLPKAGGRLPATSRGPNDRQKKRAGVRAGPSRFASAAASGVAALAVDGDVGGVGADRLAAARIGAGAAGLSELGRRAVLGGADLRRIVVEIDDVEQAVVGAPEGTVV